MEVTPSGLCVLDFDNGQVLILDVSGTPRSVPLAPWPEDCVVAPDGTTLYVSAQNSLFVVDLPSGSIVRSVPTQGRWEWLTSLVLSTDGTTLVAGARYVPKVYVFDTTALTARAITITDPSWVPSPESAGLTNTRIAVCWDANTDRLYQVDVATGSQLATMTNVAADSSASWPRRIATDSAGQRAFITRGWYTVGGAGAVGDLVVVDIRSTTGSVKGGFVGLPYATCFDPRDGTSLIVGVQTPATASISLDIYDPVQDSFSRGAYSFRNTAWKGDSLALMDLRTVD
jgi:WD40 repeat protein